MRVIVANFDAEQEMAGACTPGPHPRLPTHVRKRLVTASKALAVLDPTAAIVTSAAEIPPDASSILPWAETHSVAQARTRAGRNATAGPGDNWIEVLWRTRSDPSATAQANDRRFWFELARSSHDLLPETSVVGSLDELRDAVPRIVAHSAQNAWIVKAPFGAAGRERVYRWGLDIPSDIETRLERLFARYAELIAMPFMSRVGDFGVCGLVTDDGPRCFAPHQLITDDAGVFRRIELSGLQLDASDSKTIEDAARRAGRALFDLGHRGGFGIDGFFYRSPNGTKHLHPMCEINARLTFGHIAHAGAGSSAEQPKR